MLMCFAWWYNAVLCIGIVCWLLFVWVLGFVVLQCFFWLFAMCRLGLLKWCWGLLVCGRFDLLFDCDCICWWLVLSYCFRLIVWLVCLVFFICVCGYVLATSVLCFELVFGYYCELNLGVWLVYLWVCGCCFMIVCSLGLHDWCVLWLLVLYSCVFITSLLLLRFVCFVVMVITLI